MTSNIYFSTDMLMRKLYTLIYVRLEDQILLGLKKRGFGINKWNGFGGKVESNETVIDSAARELKEESFLDVKTCDLKNIAHVEITCEGDPSMLDMRLFEANVFVGTPKESEEMIPKWFSIDAIPYDEMWPDNRLWFPYMLKNKIFYGHFHYKSFEEGNEKILTYYIEKLNSIDALNTNRKI